LTDKRVHCIISWWICHTYPQFEPTAAIAIAALLRDTGFSAIAGIISLYAYIRRVWDVIVDSLHEFILNIDNIYSVQGGQKNVRQ